MVLSPAFFVGLHHEQDSAEFLRGTLNISRILSLWNSLISFELQLPWSSWILNSESLLIPSWLHHLLRRPCATAGNARKGAGIILGLTSLSHLLKMFWLPDSVLKTTSSYVLSTFWLLQLGGYNGSLLFHLGQKWKCSRVCWKWGGRHRSEIETYRGGNKSLYHKSMWWMRKPSWGGKSSSSNLQSNWVS